MIGRVGLVDQGFADSRCGCEAGSGQVVIVGQQQSGG